MFDSEDKAQLFRAELMAVAAKQESLSSIRTLPTTLEASELRSAERAIQIFRELDLDFWRGARWLEMHYEKPSEHTFADLIERYSASTLKHGTSSDQVSNVCKAVKRLADHLRRSNLGAITKREIVSYLESLGPVKPRTYNGMRSDLSAFFSWCVYEDLLAKNPVSGVRTVRVKKDRIPETLSPEKAEELLRWVEKHMPAWVPYLVVCLFGAVRPQRECERLHTDIRAGKKVFEPEGINVLGKNGSVRLVRYDACGPLKAWLDAYPATHGLWDTKILRWDNIWRPVRKKFELSQDVLRHTGISAMVHAPGASFLDICAVTDNSERIIKINYLGRWTAEDTRKLWSILPAGQNNQKLNA